METRRVVLIAAATVVAAAVIAVAAGVGGTSAPGPAAAAGDCEAPRSGPVTQPANAWSSLAIVAVGMGALARSRRGRDLLIGATVVAAGAASFLYHATPTAWGATLDGAAVAVLVAALAVHAWAPPLPPALAAAGIAITAAGAACLDPPALTLATGALGLAAVIGHLRRVRRHGGGDPRWPIAAATLAAAGAIAWILGRTGAALCRPESLLQAHAAWHLLIAAALGCGLAHLRSLPPTVPRSPDPL